MGKAISAVIVVVVLALAGLGYYVYKQPTDDQEAAVVVATDSDTSDKAPAFVVSTSTPAVPNAGAEVEATPVVKKPAVRPSTSQNASAYSSVSGYHNATYGLTVPGSYTVTSGPTNIFDGTYNAATLNFYHNGTLAFTIYVWSREQWSKLRNTETWNQDAGNMHGTYFGEGTYLGENFTWIYSILPQGGPVPAGISFY